MQHSLTAMLLYTLLRPILIPAVVLAGSVTEPIAQSAATPRAERAEITRGTAAVTAVIAKKYPYSVAYRSIRNCLEKNVQQQQDSDAFLIGAHLTAAFWLAKLPKDLSWRDKALARHRDIVQWLMPRLGLRADEVTHTVAQAAGFTPASEQQLRNFLRQTIRQ